MGLVSGSAVALLLVGLLFVDDTLALIGARPPPRRSKVPVMGRRQPMPSRRIPAGVGGGRHPPPNQGAMRRPPPNSSPFGRQLPAQPMPRQHYPPARLPPPSNYVGHRHGPPRMHPAPGITKPTQPTHGAPAGKVFCAPSEFYTPGQEVCCQREIVPLPYPMPAQFAQCCDGEAIDNRTEACCMGQERVHLSEGSCCGPEIYDPDYQACCGHRIYRPGGRICCGGKLMRSTGVICCKDMAIKVSGDASQYECCGSKAVDINTDTCCGHQVIESSQQSCCGKRMIYSKDHDSCCTDRTGRFRVIQGPSCAPPTTPPPAYQQGRARMVYIPGVGAVPLAPGQGSRGVYPFMPHPSQRHPSVIRQNPGAALDSRLFLFPYPHGPGNPQVYHPGQARNLQHPVTLPARSIHQPPPPATNYQPFQPIQYPSVLPTQQSQGGTRSIVYLSSPSDIPAKPTILR